MRHEQPGYDVIGDVHGEHEKLDELLTHLGYENRDGLWSHPFRRAVFIGDLIDRGNGQLEVLTTVRRMVEAGTALIVMGNHEFNAIAWATPDQLTGDYLRPRYGDKGLKNRKQHATFLAAVGEDSALHREWVAWFRTLPLWLDLDGLRVVHACWHQSSIDVLRPVVKGSDGSWCLGDDVMTQASTKGTPEYEAIECLLKGPEVALPDGVGYYDKDGHPRRKARVNWWCKGGTTLRDIAYIPSDVTPFEGCDMTQLESTPMVGHDYEYEDKVPLVFGHYWSKPKRLILDDQLVCVDLSAAKGGPLAAYRWSGETTIDEANLDWAGKKG